MSNQGKSCPKRNVDSERHCCFEKWRQSGNISWIVKVKINKNVPESFVTIVTVFSINSRYSNGSILSSVSIVSNVLLVMCIWVKTIYCHSRIQHVPPVNKFEWAFGSSTEPKCYWFIYKYLIQVLNDKLPKQHTIHMLSYQIQSTQGSRFN